MASKAHQRKLRGTPREPVKANQLPAGRDPAGFPVIGVGASAGGLEAFSELLRGLPEGITAAIIYISHLDPHQGSMLTQILSRTTRMAVVEIADGMSVTPGTVYIAPPHTEVIIRDGILHTRQLDRAPVMPIDLFFHSLAEDQGPRAIAVVLSGVATDGALGTTAIKAEGGITFAQDASAKFDGMPRSATVAGAVDFVLAPKEIAREIARIARHPYVEALGQAGKISQQELTKIFAILQMVHKVDFSHYKPTTVERRIRRRMALHRIDSVPDYISLLRSNRDELDQLYSDILIRVTGFFRDSEVFDTLQRVIFPEILRDRPDDMPVRIWVPGCATGEEVYSLAIAFLEVANETGAACPLQVFGTDVSDAAIERARVGIYPENIAGEVSAERLRRYFTKVDGSYRVSKSLRDCCIFARQDLTRDPPFSKLDLISCRNVMIYLGAVLQRKVMSIFHYALRPQGYLLLGASETIGGFGDLFGIVDRRHKIFHKRGGAPRTFLEMEAPAVPQVRTERARVEEPSVALSLFREADRVMLTRYAPAGVVINDTLDIVQFRGRTSPFLEPAPGAATFNVLKMAREGLLAELRAAIHNARKKDAPVRREGIRVRSNGKQIDVNIEVIPFTVGSHERYQLVTFEEASPAEGKSGARGKKAVLTAKEEKQAARLQRELDATREYLQSIIEEQEAMNEELRSANEEIQSSNEELQSTNEELETAKEELQSTNEELTTLNEELENRNQELAQANNDLMNLLASIDIPVLMLDSGLRIRRFNPGAERVLNLIGTDVGRSITDLRTTLDVENLEPLVTSVIENLTVRELEVRDRQGRLYSMRIRPYKTMENKIEGAVIVLVDHAFFREESSRGKERPSAE